MTRVEADPTYAMAPRGSSRQAIVSGEESREHLLVNCNPIPSRLSLRHDIALAQSLRPCEARAAKVPETLDAPALGAPIASVAAARPADLVPPLRAGPGAERRRPLPLLRIRVRGQGAAADRPIRRLLVLLRRLRPRRRRHAHAVVRLCLPPYQQCQLFNLPFLGTSGAGSLAVSGLGSLKMAPDSETAENEGG